jgi:uncharacterized protein YjbI with pentapeptide repeats
MDWHFCQLFYWDALEPPGVLHFHDALVNREQEIVNSFEIHIGDCKSSESFDGFTLSSEETWSNCRFVKCTFRASRLIDFSTERCEFQDCDLTGARLGSSVHRSSAFLNCKFIDADLYGATFENCRVIGCSFAGANLEALKVAGGDWSYAQFRMQDLDGIDFSGVKLHGADFYGASLLKACFRNAVLTEAILSRAKLRHADLRGADLTGVQLKDVDLKGARMTIDQAVLFAACHGIVIE